MRLRGREAPRNRPATRGSYIQPQPPSGRLERGVEELPGTRGAGQFEIEARSYGSDDRKRVLAVAYPPE
jgi:hypothetical protein